ncbi:MAG: radical SAM peptide maturase [Bacteroidales bacterium]|nr:radical SAM peptide maturase [Candidatus Minthousia equi]
MSTKKHANLTPSLIEYCFNHPSQVVFETTEKCNLACRYCTFRELYSHKHARGLDRLISMDINTADILLDYYLNLWKHKNYSQKEVYVSFYGGEPLMNFGLIKHVVEKIVKQENELHIIPIFSMTTNATLLERNLEFFVNHKFRLLISLDGDFEGNSLRVFGNNKANSFSSVFNTALKIKKEFPDYYKENVSFNAVLHNKNGLDKLILFFEKELEKEPLFSPISDIEINENFKEEFESMQISFQQATQEATEECAQKLWDKYMHNNPYVTQLTSHIFNNSGNVYKDLNSLMLGESIKEGAFPSGTCLPFTKKVFLTARGLILPCERISHNNCLGRIENNHLEISFEQIANIYNGYYKKLSSQCVRCDYKQACLHCVFQDDQFRESGKCISFSTNKKVEELYKQILLSHPSIYQRIMNETVIK